MHARSRKAVIVRRAALVGSVGGLAAVSLSSSMITLGVAAVTIVAVLIDMFAYARSATAGPGALDPTPTPRTITIDLSRRP